MLSVRGATATERWSRPSENRVKINFDGALFRQLDSARIGAVIRNSEGEVMATISEKIVKPPAAELIEILAT